MTARFPRADRDGPKATDAHIRCQTIVNIAVNIIIALLLYVLMHERVASFPASSGDGLLAELVTQVASVGAFGSGIPAWTTWRKVRAGELPPLGPVPPPGWILRFALLLACVLAALVAAVGAGVFLLAGTTHVGYAMVITINPLALRQTLGAR